MTATKPTPLELAALRDVAAGKDPRESPAAKRTTPNAVAGAVTRLCKKGLLAFNIMKPFPLGLAVTEAGHAVLDETKS